MKNISRFTIAFLTTMATLVVTRDVPADVSVLFNLGCGSNSCLVDPWNHLINTAKFRHDGTTLDAPDQALSRFARKRYIDAEKAFPDAASCLSQTKADNTNGLDLLAFDWAAQSSVEQLEVCLSRIHNAIGDPSVSVLWFEAFGFRAVRDTKPPGHFREGQTVIHVNWVSSSEFPAKFISSWLSRTLFGPGFSLGLRLDDNNIVQHTEITFNRN